MQMDTKLELRYVNKAAYTTRIFSSFYYFFLILEIIQNWKKEIISNLEMKFEKIIN